MQTKLRGEEMVRDGDAGSERSWQDPSLATNLNGRSEQNLQVDGVGVFVWESNVTMKDPPTALTEVCAAGHPIPDDNPKY